MWRWWLRSDGERSLQHLVVEALEAAGQDAKVEALANETLAGATQGLSHFGIM
jgi:hypothetical protein